MVNFKNTIAANMQYSPKQSIAGFPVGIIVIEDITHLLPGNVANAQSFNFPVFDMTSLVEWAARSAMRRSYP